MNWFQRLFRLPVLAFAKLFYRIRINGTENIPQSGGALLVANHFSYLDPILMGLATKRSVRFVMFEGLYHHKLLHPIVKRLDVVPISATKAKEAIRAMADAAAEGGLVCIFPEGQLSRTGMLNEFKKGFEMIARRAKVPVIPVHLDNIWGSIFSFERGKYFRKLPLQIPYNVTITIGAPIETKEATAARVRDTVQALGAEAFAARPVLDRPLAHRVAQGLLRDPSRPFIVGRAAGGEGRQVLSRASTLATTSLLAGEWRKAISSEQVAVHLPLGAPQTLATLGIVLAGKTPVQLHPGRVSEGDLPDTETTSHIVTNQPGREQLEQLGWKGEILDIGDAVRSTSAGQILLRRIALAVTPKKLAGKWIGMPANEGAIGFQDEDGEIHLTDGRTLIANVTQLASTSLFRSNDHILPLLHHFEPGAAILGLWNATLAGGTLVFPSLMRDEKTLDSVINEEAVSVVLADPHSETEITPAQDSSLRLLLSPLLLPPEESAFVTPSADDDENTPLPTRGVFYAHPDLNTILLTNAAHPPLGNEHAQFQRGAVENSPGRPLPGTAWRRTAEGYIELSSPGTSDTYLETGLAGEITSSGFFQFSELHPSGGDEKV